MFGLENQPTVESDLPTLARNEKGNSICIPLPHSQSPSKHMIPALVQALQSCELLSAHQADLILHTNTRSALQAAHLLFSSWLTADREGKRSTSVRTTFKPSQPELQPSTFRVDNFEMLMLGEQEEVFSFLCEGFENGFRLNRNSEWSTVEFENGHMPSAEVRQQLQAGIDSDIVAGFVLQRPAGAADKWQCSPIFMVPKTVLGEPTGAYRRVNDFSKENPTCPSVNATIPDELGAISYVSTQDLQRFILDLHEAGHDEIVLGKIDLKNAYRLMPIHEDDWPSLGFSDTNGRSYMKRDFHSA